MMPKIMTTFIKSFSHSSHRRKIARTRKIGRTILKCLLLAGAVVIAGSSPSFGKYFWKIVFGAHKISNRKASNAFNYYRRKGFIAVEQSGHEVAVSLTPLGKEFAGKYQIDELEIVRPKHWDGKWRIIIFDIPHELRMLRNAFRNKLRELGFYGLQKSVWVCPFECRKEVQLLREFLGLDSRHIRIIEASKIEDDVYLRKIFHI